MPATNSRTLLLVLRRPSLGAGYEWQAVRAFRWVVRVKGWEDLRVYTYRDYRVVFTVEEKTGLSLAAAATVPKVKEVFLAYVAATTRADFNAMLDAAFKHISPPEKPKTVALVSQLKP